MNVGIGIDYGPIRVEKIGKKALSHLILVGSSANSAKILEQKGKELDFDLYTTICFGYDVLYNLPNKYVSDTNGKILCSEIGTMSNTQSYMDKKSPYKIYEYTGRIRN
ncbi:hypothetical protein LCGC14_0929350 [marine sediment metagenome]|uniref:Uncharacterized protein n=1 Tax=marine sediment metagenome TaxID=412755 RepID=A0A0F9P9D5_9ZZZZ